MLNDNRGSNETKIGAEAAFPRPLLRYYEEQRVMPGIQGLYRGEQKDYCPEVA